MTSLWHIAQEQSTDRIGTCSQWTCIRQPKVSKGLCPETHFAKEEIYNLDMLLKLPSAIKMSTEGLRKDFRETRELA